MRKTAVYQIATNFVITNVKGEDFPCTRYRIAGKMLKNADDVSLDLVRAVLSATHQEGQYPTVYSNICDLREEATEIFKLNISEHPKAWNVYDSLGEAYMKRGKKELAIENY